MGELVGSKYVLGDLSYLDYSLYPTLEDSFVAISILYVLPYVPDFHTICAPTLSRMISTLDFVPCLLYHGLTFTSIIASLYSYISMKSCSTD